MHRPVVILELNPFGSGLVTELKCDSELGVIIEKQLMKNIANHELVNDDKVIPTHFEVPWKLENDHFGLKIEHVTTKMADNSKSIAYKMIHPIKDLEKDFEKLRPSRFSCDREGTRQLADDVLELIGDVLPVKLVNTSLSWHFAITYHVVELMGLENMMFSMIDYPERFHQLMSFLQQDLLGCAKWQEKEGLLTLNNGNHYAGAGSYGFTKQLPAAGFDGRVRTQDLWVNMNSQESSSISPQMYQEFILPYYIETAKHFGLIYYGCCEPVHDVWEDGVKNLNHLKKVSVSPWCDEEFMGERLRGSKVIYSRKPSPNYIAVDDRFDEEAYAKHIENTLKCARGCKLEFILRDICTLKGDKKRAENAVNVIREQINRYY